jgi:hypothetical protein
LSNHEKEEHMTHDDNHTDARDAVTPSRRVWQAPTLTRLRADATASGGGVPIDFTTTTGSTTGS